MPLVHECIGQRHFVIVGFREEGRSRRNWMTFSACALSG